jgi:transcriptional/translational regulatory protein YebC/TACO1
VLRLQRALGDARAAGVSEDGIVRMVQAACTGRPDRAKAMDLVFEGIAAHGDFPLEGQR